MHAWLRRIRALCVLFIGQRDAGKTTENPNFESLQFLLAPLHAAFTDADTGGPIYRVA
jgi:hypothetical protein